MKINLNKKLSSGSRGFTLLELMVAIAIIAILSSVVLMMTSKARARGRDGQRYSDIRQINTAIQLYLLANGTAPRFDACPTTSCGSIDREGLQPWTELATKLNPFIKKLPKDPCGASCDILDDGVYFMYKYDSPGLVNGTTLRSPSEYQISALHLETTLQPFGVSTTSTGGFTSQ